jgi:hypothetical protein
MYRNIRSNLTKSKIRLTSPSKHDISRITRLPTNRDGPPSCPPHRPCVLPRPKPDRRSRRRQFESLPERRVLPSLIPRHHRRRNLSAGIFPYARVDLHGGLDDGRHVDERRLHRSPGARNGTRQRDGHPSERQHGGPLPVHVRAGVECDALARRAGPDIDFVDVRAAVEHSKRPVVVNLVISRPATQRIRIAVA